MKYRIGSHLLMMYQAKTGQVTQRYIKVLGENETHLKVFCFQKKGYRTLIKQHILEAKKISHKKELVS